MSVALMRRCLASVTVLVMLAVLVTGCAGDGAIDPADRVEVKIAVSAPFTGDQASLGVGIRNGVQLAIEQAAPELEEMGVTLSMLAVDDADDPKTGVNAANEIVSDDAVVGVVGHLDSRVSIPASSVYNEAGVVMVSPASTNPALTLQGYENVFRVCTIDTVQGSFTAEYAYDMLGFASAAVIDDGTPYGRGLAGEFVASLEARGGTITSADKVEPGARDFSALVSRIRAADPDLVFFGGGHAEAARVSRQLKEAGLEGPVMGGDSLHTQEYIDIAGAANAEGDFATTIGLQLYQLPGGPEFEESYAAAFPDQAIQAHDAYAHDAALVIIEAIKSVVADLGVDALTTAVGRQAIVEAVAVTRTQGVAGTVAFDEKGDTTNKAVSLHVVSDGQWVPFED